MLYIVRSRMKESTTGADLGPMNRTIDEEALPALRNVDGVNAAQAYNSITGEVVVVLDLESIGVIERVLSDQATSAAVAKFMEFTVRTGGEVLYDRPVWQQLYGND